MSKQPPTTIKNFKVGDKFSIIEFSSNWKIIGIDGQDFVCEAQNKSLISEIGEKDTWSMTFVVNEKKCKKI